MTALGKFIERQLLVVALRADDAGEAAFLAEQRAAVERPLHQAVGEAEHRQWQLHARRILQIARVDRLGLVLRRIGNERLQLVRADGDDDAIERPAYGAEILDRRVQADLAAT